MQIDKEALILLSVVAFGCPIFANPAFSQVSRDQRMVLSEHVNRANYLMARGEFQPAIDEYNQCFLVDPNNQTAKDNIVLCHNNWGISLFHRHKYEEAKAQWDQALELNPNDRNARQNLRVLKATLDRQGVKPGGGDKSEEGGAKKAAAKSPVDKGASEPSGGVVILGSGGKPAAASDETSSAAVILTNGRKQSTSNDSSSASAVIINSGAKATAGDEFSPASSGDSGSTSSIKILPSSNGVASPTDQPAPAPSPKPPTSLSPGGLANMDEELGAIEVKVYGHKQDSIPIFKRLEKLEMDSGGAVKQGTVQERIDGLRKSYGL